MNTSEFHVITSERETLAFHLPTFSLLRVPPVMADYLRGEEVSDVPEEVRQLHSHMETILSRQPRVTWAEPENHVTFVVTQQCNLACTYCFATGGSYGLPIGRMSRQTAVMALRVFEQQGPIKSITFFGGEPTLNLDAIEAVCADLKSCHEQGDISTLPHYMIVTNGTNLTKRALHVINAYSINPIVSIDGPESVCSVTRTNQGGRSAFPQIVNGIRTLQSDTALPVMYEATYTSVHEDQHVTLADVVRYMKDTLGLDTGTLAFYAGDQGDPMSPNRTDRSLAYRQVTDAILESLTTGASPILNDTVLSLLRSIVSRESYQHVCTLGKHQWAVMPNGDVYPCHLFINASNDFRMGNVHDENFGPQSSLWQGVMDRLGGLDKQENGRCAKCWAQRLCKGCPGAQYVSKGVAREMQADHCAFFRSQVDHMLVRLADIQRDPAKWHALKQSLGAFSESSSC